jgi:hypothetical protein
MLSLNNNNYNINTNTQHQPNSLYYQHQWNNTTQQLQHTPIIPGITFNTTNNEHLQLLPTINENSNNVLPDNNENITPITVTPIKKGTLIDYYIIYIFIYLENQIFITQKRKRDKNSSVSTSNLSSANQQPQQLPKHSLNKNTAISNRLDDLNSNTCVNCSSSNTSTTTNISGGNNNCNNINNNTINGDELYLNEHLLNTPRQSKVNHNTFIINKAQSSTKKKQETPPSPIKPKTFVITHQNYINTKSTQDFMTYNFNLEFNNNEDNDDICLDETSSVYQHYDECKQHVNKNNLNKTLTLINSTNNMNMPKRIWNNTDVNQNTLTKQIAVFEKKWPRKIVDFNEELALQILKMCKFDYKKCETYISSQEFKTLLIKLKKKNGSSSLECFSK